MAEQEVTITVTPDPLWTAEDEAAAQFWLDLIRRSERRQPCPGSRSRVSPTAAREV